MRPHKNSVSSFAGVFFKLDGLSVSAKSATHATNRALHVHRAVTDTNATALGNGSGAIQVMGKILSSETKCLIKDESFSSFESISPAYKTLKKYPRPFAPPHLQVGRGLDRDRERHGLDVRVPIKAGVDSRATGQRRGGGGARLAWLLKEHQIQTRAF